MGGGREGRVEDDGDLAGVDALADKAGLGLEDLEVPALGAKDLLGLVEEGGYR